MGSVRKARKVCKIGIVCILAVVLCAFGVFYGVFFNEVNALISIKKVDKGVYFMTYKNDYYFDDFLEQGASNDEELKTFLMQKVLHGIPVDLVIPQYGCSSFTAETPDGERLFARNYDWDDNPVMVVKTKPKKGYASISVVDLSNLGYDFKNLPSSITEQFLCLAAPYIPLDGINERGVAISVNMLNGNPTSQNNGRTPITTTTLVRLVLDKASNVNEALALIAEYELHDSAGGRYHYQIADSHGRSVVVEYENDNMLIIEGEGNFQAMTNFVLNEVGDRDEFGEDRYDIMQNILQADNGILTEQGAMDTLKEVKMEWENNDESTGGSVWSIVYNLDRKSARMVFFRNFDEIYDYYL